MHNNKKIIIKKQKGKSFKKKIKNLPLPASGLAIGKSIFLTLCASIVDLTQYLSKKSAVKFENLAQMDSRCSEPI